MQTISLTTVLIASSLTALFTGLGALPFLFVKNIGRKTLGIANAAAAGLMLGASLGLTWEGAQISIGRLVVGLALGVMLIVITRRLLGNDDEDEHASAEDLADASFRKILLIMVVMTVHSFAEGIGVGVSFGGGQSLGQLITAAIAIHNIPEGLAISLVMIPRGKSVWQAGFWSVFSSLPQPLMAIPAFLFVLAFEPFLPLGLGLAAGAMFYMVFSELLPEAKEDAPSSSVMATLLASAGAMLLFQLLVG